MTTEQERLQTEVAALRWLMQAAYEQLSALSPGFALGIDEALAMQLDRQPSGAVAASLERAREMISYVVELRPDGNAARKSVEAR